MEFPVSKKDITFNENIPSNKTSKLQNRFDSLVDMNRDATLFRYPAFTISKSPRFLDLHSNPFNGYPSGFYFFLN